MEIKGVIFFPMKGLSSGHRKTCREFKLPTYQLNVWTTVLSLSYGCSKSCWELKLWTEKTFTKLKLPTFRLNVWIKIGSFSSECLDNCPELKLWMFKIPIGAQALDTEKHLQSLSSGCSKSCGERKLWTKKNI